MADRSRSRTPVRLVAVALLAGLVSACSPFDDLMVAIFGRSMRDQRSFDPYENTLLPPEGSVPFSAGNFSAGPDQVSLGQADPSAEMPPFFTATEVLTQAPVVMEMVNPVEATAESLARGERLYNRFCVPCHSADGVGANAALAPLHPMVPLFNLSSAATAVRHDGYMYGVIRVGRGLMPAYGHQIPHYDRWHIVNYIRQMQEQAGNPAPGE